MNIFKTLNLEPKMITPVNEYEPAFPAMGNTTYKGMFLRDWFAGQANEQDIKHHQQFIQYDRPYGEKPKPPEPKYTREQARYRFADAMLATRNQYPSKS